MNNEITQLELVSMSLSSVFKYFERIYVNWQVRQHQRHLEHLARNIENDRRAMQVLQHELMLLTLRLRG